MTTATRSVSRRRRAPRGSGEQLRVEIITAARRLLAEAGDADAVSMRAVADAVGVTSPSLYLHFADKDALIAAVVADVFTELDAAMLEAADGITDPLERLRAFGLAYVRFALSHPQHYRIAVMDPCPTPDVDRVLASSAFTHFQQAVTACMDAGIFAPDDPLPITLELWTVAHGVASLMITKPFMPWGDPEEFTDRVLCAAALGRSAANQAGEPSPRRRRGQRRPASGK
ncbi:MAG TPA: TetR/AcrR family transcriptional regulator [Mycobacteriales bacterium]|nr:TetR/AcrR family transcriptional regulator [Mycobacteriales bacterium]